MIPRATLRLQFHREFTLDDAMEQVDYAASLGVSHVYASPLWTARSGSTHGYDIVDPTRINPELGGEPALRRFVAALRARGMGLVLDIVPNHMGVGVAENPWWQDVLEWGTASRYAQWFDIDWHPSDPALQGRVLAPFLGQGYGQALEAAELSLQFDAELGSLYCAYFSHRFPIAAGCYADVIEACTPEPSDASVGPASDRAPRASPSAVLRPAAEAFRAAVPPDGPVDRAAWRAAQIDLARLARTPEGGRALDAARACFDATDPAGRERLHALLERQHYRLAHWRTAGDEINWRRFFEVNDLAGLRIERPEVFEAVHSLSFALYAEGLIDGVRIDHIDGLEDPSGYCRQLRQRFAELQSHRPAGLREAPAYLVVEKILAFGETLPAGWLADGTTGYDFMDQVGALLHDPAGETPLAELWQEQAGGLADPHAEIQAAKLDVLNENLAAELAATARAFHAVAAEDLATRDMTLQAISRVLSEFLLHLDVYRVYLLGGGDVLGEEEAAGEGRPNGESDPARAVTPRRSLEDRAVIERTLSAARATLRSPDEAVLDQLGRWLLCEGALSEAHRRAVVRFEHLTPPLAAKSVEDTAFYRYGRLLSRNEVGSGESPFAIDVEAFHRANAERAARTPHAMLATSTHDHKRGADLRARLAVLSERPAQWAQTTARWRQLNALHREHAPVAEPIEPAASTLTEAPIEPPAPVEWPTAADELMLYQMLVGSWPPTLRPGDRDARIHWARRVSQWQQKSLREAQRLSSWAQPNEAYEGACERFLQRILGLDDATSGQESSFVESLYGYVESIAAAGALNGLAQAVLHLSAPGVPDIYQGMERWDFSLVDPDNRTPVDFASRRATLADARPLAALIAAWHDGAVKQVLTARLLALRAQHARLFAVGGYEPLALRGARQANAIAFARRDGEDFVVVVATLRASHWLGIATGPLMPPARWDGTELVLPADFGDAFTDLLGDGALARRGEGLLLAEVLKELPVAVLRARAR